jgi:pimeloyl-ACP methyl ester carboxylesterase
MIAKVAGAELAYETAGEGPAVLFLHAFPLGLFMWEAQVRALQGSHTVVRFDARGFGGSPVDDGLLTMERIADDGVGLLDHLGIARAVVAGCSMGGYAAFALFRRHPDRVRALVLQDTRAGADADEGRRNRALLAEKTLREGAVAARDAFLPKLLGRTSHAERPELVARVEKAILGASPRAIANALHGLGARADSTPTLREVGVPTLVVCGEEDAITPVAESKAMAAAIAGSRLAVIPRAGHVANLEEPETFNRVLLEFLTVLR